MLQIDVIFGGMSCTIRVVCTYLISSKEFRVCVDRFRFNGMNHANNFQSFEQLGSTISERSENAGRFPFNV